MHFISTFACFPADSDGFICGFCDGAIIEQIRTDAELVLYLSMGFTSTGTFAIAGITRRHGPSVGGGYHRVKEFENCNSCIRYRLQHKRNSP